MQKHKEWPRFAYDDLRVAQTILNSDYVIIGIILYYCQQSIEKSLKAYLSYAKYPIKKTHDLVELVHLCSETDDDVLQFLEVAVKLTPYAPKSRYPDNALLMPHASFADWAAKQTTIIFEFVQNKINRK